jgi:tripartite-type tricarboxylate transporter receptor subunit TctC
MTLAKTRTLVSAAALAVLLPGVALAQNSEQFYRGKTVNLYIGFSAGGSYDYYGRLVSRYIGKHLPGNPTVVAQSMPGAGSFKAANYIYNVAPKDGTAMGIVSQTMALEEALGTPGIKYKSANFNWIGRVTNIVEVTLTWETSKAKTIEDAMKYVTQVASTGPGSPSMGYPLLLNALAGTKFKIITGYTGSTAGMLAMERGEVDGALTSYNTLNVSKQDWLKNKKINLLVQYTLERSPEMPNVPSVVELGKTAEGKQMLGFYAGGGEIGRSFLATPGIPADRVKVMRAAFDATMKDPAFKAEIDKSKAEFNPLPGEKLQKLIEDFAKAPPAMIAHMRELLQSGESQSKGKSK